MADQIDKHEAWLPPPQTFWSDGSGAEDGNSSLAWRCAMHGLEILRCQMLLICLGRYACQHVVAAY